MHPKATVRKVRALLSLRKLVIAHYAVFSHGLQALPNEAQCLFLRLFLRKGPWFRLDTLSYSELTDVTASAQQLCEAGMAIPLYSFTAQSTQPSPSVAVATDAQGGEAGGCSLAAAEGCSAQLVCGVAEALTVAELQLLLGKLDLTGQGKTAGISKGQVLQLLKGGLEQAKALASEVHSQWTSVLSLACCCIQERSIANNHKVTLSTVIAT